MVIDFVKKCNRAVQFVKSVTFVTFFDYYDTVF